MRQAALMLVIIILSILWTYDHGKQEEIIKCQEWCEDSLVKYVNFEDSIHALFISNDSMRLAMKRKFVNPFDCKQWHQRNQQKTQLRASTEQ